MTPEQKALKYWHLFITEKGHEPMPFEFAVFCLDKREEAEIPDILKSETRLTKMAEMHKPKIEDGKSDFHFAWRLCYEWIRETLNASKR